VLVALRLMLCEFGPEDPTPPYWVLTGAITVLAGARIIEMADAPMVRVTRYLIASSLLHPAGRVGATSSPLGATDAERCPGSQLKPFQWDLRLAAWARAVASTLQSCQCRPDLVEDALDAEPLGFDHDVVGGFRKLGEHHLTSA
jgi:hypothetical protein